MNRIRKINDLIRNFKVSSNYKKKPFLGICVGMQILADYGYENKKTKRIILDKWRCKALKKFISISKT